jgi:predicted amidohydrolase YtcJ
MRLSATRRAFLLTSASFAFLATTAVAQEFADTIYAGGPILTIDDANPRAEAVAVTAGRIAAVGTLEEVSRLKGPATRMVDLAGRTMLPGFIDPHGHVMMGGLQALSANMLPPPDGDVDSIAALQDTLRTWMDANRDAMERAGIILGFGYDHSQLAELRPPTREELDAVSIDLPVVVVHQSGHIGAFNSKALEIAGYTADSEDPDGGKILRKEGTREPNGIVEETAFFEALPKLLGNVGPAGFEAFTIAGAEMWASFGYTTAQEGRANSALNPVLQKLTSDGSVKIDIYAYADVLLGRDYIRENVSRSYDKGFRLAGAKLTIDGSAQGFTAWRDRPYVDPVGDYPPGYLGYPAVTNEDVISALDWAYANDVQIIVHANGEAAADLLLAATRNAVDQHGQGDRRTVLIHGQYQREDQVENFVRLGVIPSLFTMHTFYWGDWHRDHTVGPDFADNISPTGWYRKRGSPVTVHTDAPVAFPDTMRALDATVTRRTRSGDILGPSQRLDVMTALQAMTLWAAYQAFEDTEKGSIEVGKVADFVILSDDPTTVDPDSLDQLLVVQTVKADETIYLRGERKTELLRRRDVTWPGYFEMFKELHIRRQLALLPEGYRTAEARAHLEQGYEDCAATLLLPWLFGLTDAGSEMASR